MPNYDFCCSACSAEMTLLVPLVERDTFKKCPVCGKKKLVRQVSAASFVYDTVKKPLTRAGNGWSDVLKKIKSGSGKNNTIHHK